MEKEDLEKEIEHLNIKLELVQGSYWEHHKIAKDFSLILPLDNPKRKNIEKSMNELSDIIHLIKSQKEELTEKLKQK